MAGRGGQGYLRVLLPVVLLLFLASPALDAVAAESPAAAEKRLKAAREQLQKTGNERRELERQLAAAQEQLRQTEARLARISREVATLEKEMATLEEDIAASSRRRQALGEAVAAQRAQLASLLRTTQAQGNRGGLRLLLSQGQVQDTQRYLAYNRYLQDYRIRTLAAVNADLAELAEVERRIGEKKEQLAQRRESAQALNASLAGERRRHAAQVQALDRAHGQQKSREQALSRDVRSLETLLANLRAQAARAEAQRRQAQQQARQREQQAARTAPSSSRRSPSPTARQTAPAARVGGGSWPVSGTLVTRYGARLADGRSSTGLLIEAPAGTPVTAVQDGTVVFADWMTGYGNILIIDHGNGYLSLYAHNESLLRSQGQRVRRGEAVARVGSSGGQGRNALYFELRRNGQPVDPAIWLRR